MNAIQPEWTGWLYTDAVRNSGCPKCKALSCVQCHTPIGRKAWPPHRERIEELCRVYPEAIKYATGGTPERMSLLEKAQHG
jgi:hypothetical protein